jgi:hypothetical protein
MAQKIDTYQDFLREIVEPDLNDFLADKSNLRRAWAVRRFAISLARLGLRSTQDID